MRPGRLSTWRDHPKYQTPHRYFLRTIVARVILGKALSGDAFKHFHAVASMENTGLTVLRYQVGVDQGPC